MTDEPQQPPYGEQQPNWGSSYPPPPPGHDVSGQQNLRWAPNGPPKHPQATTALVLGIVSIAGAFVCLLPIFLSPVAWVIGGRAVKEIDAHPGQYSGRSDANAGRIMGIIGTVLAVFGAVIIIGIAGLLIAVAAS